MNRLLRVGILVIPISFFAYCGWSYFAVSGHWSVSTNLAQEHVGISQLYPVGRVNMVSGEEWHQEIVGEPVYVNVRAPQTFDRAVLTLTMNAADQPVVNAGVVTRPEPLALQMQLMHTALLNDARSAGWRSVVDGASTLFTSRDDVYGLDDVKSTGVSRVAVAGEYIPSLVIPECVAQHESFTLPFSIQGDHEIAFALPRDLATEIRLSSNNSEAQVSVVDNAKLRSIVDARYSDGVYTLSLPAQEQDNVYYLHIRQSKQAVFSEVTFPTHCVSAQKFAIASLTTPVTLLTTGRRATLTAAASEAFAQHTVFGESALLSSIGAPQVYYQHSSDNSIQLTSGSISVLTNGFFSFDSMTAFDPRGQVLPLDETTQLSDIDVLIVPTATAAPLDQEQEVYRTDIDLSRVAGDRTVLQFVIATPGIAVRETTIPVYRVRVDLYRDPLWTKVWNKLTRILQ